MKDVLFITCGQSEDVAAYDNIKRLAGSAARIEAADIYSFDAQPLERFAALLIGLRVDQRFLAARAERLNRFVEAGGTAVVNGQIVYPFIAGLSLFRPLQDYRVEDLVVRRETAHPVWEGVAVDELTFRRGVAGFYGRGWHEPPPGATVIHTIGADRHPVDFVYPLGAGRVLFHGGNSLWQEAGPNDTTGRIVPQLIAWLVAQQVPS